MSPLPASAVLLAAPRVQLLDARIAGLDPDGLRSHARARAAACPDAHVTRSYRHPFALIASHTERVGVDIERVEPYDPEFAQSICTPSENSGAFPASAQELASQWCSKEALAKALGDALHYDPRRLDSPARWPDGQAPPWRALALKAPAGHVAWICWHIND